MYQLHIKDKDKNETIKNKIFADKFILYDAWLNSPTKFILGKYSDTEFKCTTENAEYTVKDMETKENTTLDLNEYNQLLNERRNNISEHLKDLTIEASMDFFYNGKKRRTHPTKSTYQNRNSEKNRTQTI